MGEEEKGNIYDRIFKENAESLFMPIIERELGIKIIKYKALQEKITKTIEREMDFLYKAETANEKEFLLHIEFQSKSEKDMIYRMVEYHGLVFRKYQLPIRHIVIYLGKGKSRMRKTLRIEEQFRQFDLININQLDTSTLLSSQIPEVILLSVLSKFEKQRAESILRLIVMRLKSVCESDKELLKYQNQLLLLSRMRKLEKLTIKIIKDMPVTYDIEKDGLYIQGMEKGVEKGILGMHELGGSIERIAQNFKISVEKVKEVLRKHNKLK